MTEQTTAEQVPEESATAEAPATATDTVHEPAAEPQPAPPSSAQATLPASVTLGELYGYFDDAGTLRMWQEGQTVTDAAEVADLIARKAPLKD